MRIDADPAELWDSWCCRSARGKRIDCADNCGAFETPRIAKINGYCFSSRLLGLILRPHVDTFRSLISRMLKVKLVYIIVSNYVLI